MQYLVKHVTLLLLDEHEQLSHPATEARRETKAQDSSGNENSAINGKF